MPYCPIPVNIVSGTTLPLTLTASGNPCGSNTVNFAIATSGADLNGYTISYGDGNAQTLCLGGNQYCPSSETLTYTYQSAGTYTVTISISGAPACAPTLTETIDVGLTPTVTVASDPGCGQAQLYASSYPSSSGTTYLWSNGSTIARPIVTVSGTYSVTATFTSGCTVTASKNVTFLDPLAVVPTVTNPRCSGDGSGSISLAISGGHGIGYGYGVTWPSSILASQISSNGFTATGLSGGSYTITVADAVPNDGCVTTLNVIVTDPAPIQVSATQGLITCSGDTDGQINLTVTGGTPYGHTLYYYQWSSNVTQTSNNGADAIDLGAGTYTVTVNDANGCSVVDTFLVGQPPAMSISGSVTNIPCDASGGSISISVSGGIHTPFGYVYSWSNGATTQNLNGPLTPGIYTVTAFDLGCSVAASFTVTQDSCCTPPIAKLFFPDTVCIGSTDTVKVSGGTWGRIIIDGDPTLYFNVSSFTAQGGLALPIPASAIGTTHNLCYIAFSSNPDSPRAFCSDTFCLTFVAVNCCTKPIAYLVINGDTMTGFGTDTLCQDVLPNIQLFGGEWGQIIVDGRIIQDSPQDTNWYFSMDSFIAGGGFPIGKLFDSVAGFHTLCFIAATDSASHCADTICANIFIRPCCTPPVAIFTINGSSSSTDTVCLGSTAIFYASGAPWGKVVDHPNSKPFIQIPAAGYTDTTIVDGANALGTHTICFIASADSLGTCTDTVCITVVVIDCGCGALYGTSHLISNSQGNMQYQFYDSFTSIAPNFINWIVDGSTVGRTVGTDSFVYQFGPGPHIVCMETGTFLTGPNGDNICCYNTICDSIDIDACAFWKATDSITYVLDSTNVDSVTFTFHGSTSPLWPTLIWNFGDGTTLVSSDLTVGHLFPQGGLGLKSNIQNVCVDVIWSRGDSITYDSLSVCCCVDTICLTVTTTPCALPVFYIVAVDSSSGSYVYQVLHSTSYTDITNTNWNMYSTTNNPVTPAGLASSSITGSGPFFNVTPPSSGEYTICASFEYTVLYNGNQVLCNGYICQNFDMQAEGPTGGLSIYPNPNNGQAILQLINYSEAKSAKIEISDMTGQTVLTRTINGLSRGITQNYMDISNLPQGIYTVKMTMGSIQQVSKLTKE